MIRDCVAWGLKFRVDETIPDNVIYADHPDGRREHFRIDGILSRVDLNKPVAVPPVEDIEEAARVFGIDLED